MNDLIQYFTLVFLKIGIIGGVISLILQALISENFREKRSIVKTLFTASVCFLSLEIVGAVLLVVLYKPS